MKDFDNFLANVKKEHDCFYELSVHRWSYDKNNLIIVFHFDFDKFRQIGNYFNNYLVEYCNLDSCSTEEDVLFNVFKQDLEHVILYNDLHNHNEKKYKFYDLALNDKILKLYDYENPTQHYYKMRFTYLKKEILDPPILIRKTEL